MCGFIAFVATDPAATLPFDELDRGLDALEHRGSQSSMWTHRPGLLLGHVRLPVFDLSSASGQPFARWSRAAGQAPPGVADLLVFNGSVLNFRRLPYTAPDERSDTRALAEHLRRSVDAGRSLEAALGDLDGPFAFCWWDARARRLVVARDRVGQRPLYRAWTTAGVWYASEAQALARALGIDRLDEEWAQHYLRTLDGVPGSTPWAQVTEVPPGTVETAFAGAVGRITVTSTSWWRWAPRPECGATPSLDELDDALRESVQDCTEADVPVAAYLSGGLDSGLIAHYAQGRVGVLATVGWRDAKGGAAGGDERAQAEEAVARLRAFQGQHLAAQVSQLAAMNLMTEAHAYIDHPRAGSCWPNLAAARLASAPVAGLGGRPIVVLDGAGSDECWGGYPWRAEAYAHTGLGAFWARGVDASWFAHPHDLLLGGLVLAEEARSFEVRRFLPQLLTVADRLSLRAGLEVRCPFLSKRMLDLAQRADANALVVDGWGKQPLRALARSLGLPSADRTKQGFTGPDRVWFRVFAPIFAGELAGSDVLRRLLRLGAPGAILADHSRQVDAGVAGAPGQRDHRHAIWAMLSLARLAERHGLR